MKTATEQKQTVYNIIASVLIGGINFFTAPIFTRMLGAEQYGLFSVDYSWVTILLCFMGLQMKEALATGILDYRDDYRNFRNTTLLFSAAAAAALFLICAVFRKPLMRFTGYSSRVLLLLFLTAFTHYIIGFVQNTLIFEKKAQLNLLLSVTLVAFVVLCSVLFISRSEPETRHLGRLLGFTVPYSVYSVLCCFLLLSGGKTAPKREYLRYSLSFGSPIVFHMLSNVILSQSDRVMMRMFGTPDADIGIYSFFFALAGALTMIKDALNSSWRPFYYDYLSEGNTALIRSKTRNHTELFTALTCAFLLVSREVGILMAGKEYSGGTGILPVLVLCVYFTFIYQFPVNYELYHKKTRTVAGCTVAAALINIILNALMIPRYGMYGAGIATAASYLCLSVIHLAISVRLSRGDFALSFSSFLPGTLAVLAASAVFYALPEQWPVRWLLAVLLGIFELTRVLQRKSVF